jgi:hypothetical protein
MHMALKSTHVNGHAPHVSGRGLRRRRLTRVQRVQLAADLIAREAQLDPSIGQACDLLQVPVGEVRNELKYRAAKSKVSALVAAWEAASELEQEAAIHSIGAAAVWDRLARVVA